MHRAPETFLQQVVGGRWRLLELRSATERGTAFRVETLEDGRPAELELWDLRHVEGRGELARFEREARTLSRLGHPRCRSIVAFGAHEGRPFLVSDLPDGKTLADELGEADLSVPRAVSLGLQLLEGLGHLHRHGVAHRALRPENVWVVRSPAAEELKLGLPRVGQVSDAGHVRLYLPPERSAAKLDTSADLYAAGMLLYVMCTGRAPSEEVVAATAGGAPVPAPRAVSPERGISEGLERVIMRAVAPARDVRFGTADELLAALQSVGVRLPTQKRRPSLPPRKRTAFVATAFATVAFLGAVALRSSGGPAPIAPPAAQAAPMQSIAARAAVEPPAPSVEPKPEIAPRPVPPAQIAATRPAARAHDEHDEIWSLLDSGRLDEGATRIKPLVAKDPDAAWPRLALGALYSRKQWRRDSVKQWKLALAQDPEIRRDPQFGAYLCFMLDDDWRSAGVEGLLDQLGTAAAQLLDRCVATAKSPRLRALASRALKRSG